MSQTFPLIKVVSGDSYALIREQDFDPKIHQPYEERAVGAVREDGGDGDGGGEGEAAPRKRTRK